MKKHADLLIRHADYLDENFELQKGSSIAVADGKIEKIDTLEQLNETYTSIGRWTEKAVSILPGLVRRPYAYRPAASAGPRPGRDADDLDKDHASLRKHPDAGKKCVSAPSLPPLT